MFKIEELIEEYGHTVLQLPPYHCHFNSIELVWLQAKRYYNSNIGKNGFGMEAMKKMWEESLEQVCSFCSTTKQRCALSHEIHSIINLVEFC
jgi:transposase